MNALALGRLRECLMGLPLVGDFARRAQHFAQDAGFGARRR